MLLDTHALLWFLGDDLKLPSGIKEKINDRGSWGGGFLDF